MKETLNGVVIVEKRIIGLVRVEKINGEVTVKRMNGLFWWGRQHKLIGEEAE